MKKIKTLFIYWAYYLMYYVKIKIKSYGAESDDYTLLCKGMMYALKTHHKCGQKYDKKYPYYYHLEMVLHEAFQYLHLVDYDVKCLLGALFHDLIEDCRLTFNDVKEMWGEEVADIVFACTELRGRNRKERHGPEYYKGLNGCEKGKYVKVCDVKANMTMGKRTGSSMFGKYQKEYPHFKKELYDEQFEEIFNSIENNFINIPSIAV